MMKFKWSYNGKVTGKSTKTDFPVCYKKNMFRDMKRNKTVSGTEYSVVLSICVNLIKGSQQFSGRFGCQERSDNIGK